MSDLQIRAALPRDLEGVNQVFSLADRLHRDAHPEIFQAVDDPQEIKAYLLAGIQAENAAVFVAEVGRQIAGAVIAWERQTPEIPLLVRRTFVSVDNLVVADEYRGRGLGQALMAQVHLWARQRELAEIQLTVWDFNQGALAFYEKLGYQMLHHRMRKDLP